MTVLLPATAHVHSTAIFVTPVGVVLIGPLGQRLLGQRRADGRPPGSDVRPRRHQRKTKGDGAVT